jgi:hypothetical protein
VAFGFGNQSVVEQFDCLTRKHLPKARIPRSTSRSLRVGSFPRKQEPEVMMRQIAAREIKALYPDNVGFHSFVDALEANRLHQGFEQMALDYLVSGAKLIQTEADVREMNERMGWNRPDFTGPLNREFGEK